MISEPSIIIPVDHPSRVAEVRRNAAVAAQSEGFGEQACEEVSIIATEIGTNLIKHAHGGQVQISRLSASDEPGIEILIFTSACAVGKLGSAVSPAGGRVRRLPGDRFG